MNGDKRSLDDFNEEFYADFINSQTKNTELIESEKQRIYSIYGGSDFLPMLIQPQSLISSAKKKKKRTVLRVFRVVMIVLLSIAIVLTLTAFYMVRTGERLFGYSFRQAANFKYLPPEVSGVIILKDIKISEVEQYDIIVFENSDNELIADVVTGIDVSFSDDIISGISFQTSFSGSVRGEIVSSKIFSHGFKNYGLYRYIYSYGIGTAFLLLLAIVVIRLSGRLGDRKPQGLFFAR